MNHLLLGLITDPLLTDPVWQHLLPINIVVPLAVLDPLHSPDYF